MYSYVFCHYLKDSITKTHFENVQKNLQKRVEEVSKFLERDINKICETKKLQDLNFHAKFCKDQSFRLIDNVKESKWEYEDL